MIANSFEVSELWSVRSELKTMRFSRLNALLKHILHTILYSLILLYGLHSAKLAWNTDKRSEELLHDPIVAYGLSITVCLYILRSLSLLALPQVLFNFFGLFFLNAFHEDVENQTPSADMPKLRFRCVTRGTFPELVFRTVERNMETIRRVRVVNYLYEVVTDNAILLPVDELLRQIVVPSEYRSKTGALFKSRALQYCLESGVYDCDDSTWIVHLDEETLLTERSVNGKHWQH